MKKGRLVKGFTLVELLVVISIISFLSSIILASLNSARAKARDAQRVESLTQLRNALELYYSSYGSYPKTTNWNVDSRPLWDGFGDGGGLYHSIVTAGFISSLPLDPSPKTSCWYGPTGYLAVGPSLCRGEIYMGSSDGQCYILGTNLEKPSTNPYNGGVYPGSWCGNYQIISGNCKCTDFGSPY